MPAAHPPDAELYEIGKLGYTPRLLLHCCCAPCASSVLEYLSPFFDISCLFYNPNIRPKQEYDKRRAELIKLLSQAEYPNGVRLLESDYDPGVFDEAAAPYRDEPEGGLRCSLCFDLRLSQTAKNAKESGFDYFTTTLSVSPLKNAAVLNEIGEAAALRFGVRYLQSDFKKRDGYKRSVVLAKQYGLYRQSYCGCKPRDD